MITGHFTVSALLHRYLKVNPGPVLLAGAFPDIVDKTLHQGLGVTRSGRTIAHTLLALGLTTAFVHRLWGAESAKSWALGYLAHLVCDLDGFIPWFFPFARYQFPTRCRPSPNLFKRVFVMPTLVEILLFAWMFVLMAGRFCKATGEPT